MLALKINIQQTNKQNNIVSLDETDCPIITYQNSVFVSVFSSKNNYLMVILVPSVAIPLVLVCICLFLFLCRWKNSRSKKGIAKEATKPIVMTTFTPMKVQMLSI